MAKAICICSRSRPFGEADEESLRKICGALTPDNISGREESGISQDGGVAHAVMNAGPSNAATEKSLLMGCLYGEAGEWDAPLSGRPDGSYAIFRWDNQHFEASTDPVASRSIWYYFDDNTFIASNSQRAIVMALGSFEFDESVIPWMLSSGTLGPGLSWDGRIRMVPADSSVILDRRKWSVSVEGNPVRYEEAERSDQEHREIVEEALEQTFESFKPIDLDSWALTLSGGYDSRAILCWLMRGGHIDGRFRTVTWGLERSRREEMNDARIAEIVAETFGVRHTFYPTDKAAEPVSGVIDRYLECGEGRSDHISAYMDGMALWSALLDDGIRGIIKGDQFFGWPPVTSPELARLQTGCQMCRDLSNLDGIIRKFDLPEQEFPSWMERKGESLLAWRDRLYLAYRVPVFVAAMSDIKFSYMEQMTPLFSRKILDRVRELPDRLRLDKGMYRRIVDSVCPDLPYADHAGLAPASLGEILRNGEVTYLLHEAIRSDRAARLLGRKFLSWVESGMSAGRSTKAKGGGGLGRLKKMVPRSIKARMLSSGLAKPAVDGNVLAFRVYIILRMHQILTEDGRRFSPA